MEKEDKMGSGAAQQVGAYVHRCVCVCMCVCGVCVCVWICVYVSVCVCGVCVYVCVVCVVCAVCVWHYGVCVCVCGVCGVCMCVECMHVCGEARSRPGFTSRVPKACCVCLDESLSFSGLLPNLEK